MKNQALFSSKDKSKKLKCRLLHFLFGALRVKTCDIDHLHKLAAWSEFSLFLSIQKLFKRNKKALTTLRERLKPNFANVQANLSHPYSEAECGAFSHVTIYCLILKRRFQ